LPARGFGLQGAQRSLGIGDDTGVVLGLAKLQQPDLILELAIDATDGGDAVIERIALLHQLAGAAGIVPEIGILGFAVELGESYLRDVEVKDSSSAVGPTA
jgi:hypothetical protein